MTRRLLPLACMILLLAGCALSRHPRIAELKYDSGRYQNHTVTLDGVVTSSWGVPLVPFRLYKIDDGTGEVTVVSSSGRVPSRGSRVSVTGRVEEFATLGGQSIGLHIQQRDIHFRTY